MIGAATQGRGKRAWIILVVGGLLVFTTLAGCDEPSGNSVDGGYVADSLISPRATFEDGSPYSASELEAAETCMRRHPFDDGAFLACTLREVARLGSASGRIAEPTSTMAAAGHIVLESLTACPDFIEVTFHNDGGRPASILEKAVYLSDSGDPFSYFPHWAPTIGPGDTVTWRITPGEMGRRQIPAGVVEVSIRGDSTGGQSVTVEGSNPHESCTTKATATTAGM